MRNSLFRLNSTSRLIWSFLAGFLAMSGSPRGLWATPPTGGSAGDGGPTSHAPRAAAPLGHPAGLHILLDLDQREVDAELVADGLLGFDVAGEQGGVLLAGDGQGVAWAEDAHHAAESPDTAVG